MPKTHLCLGCNALFTSASGLWKHHVKEPTHKTSKTDEKTWPAFEAVANFLCEGHEGNRRARLNELARQLTIDELKNIFLPEVAKNTTLYDFLLQQCTISRHRHESSFSGTCMFTKLGELIDIVKKRHPLALPISTPSQPINKVKNIEKFLQASHGSAIHQFIDDRHLPTSNFKPWINKLSNDQAKTLLHDVIRKVHNQHYDKFVSFSVAITSNFNISQQAYQNILRNNLGKQLEDIIGINIFASKIEMVKNLNSIKSTLKDVFELKFTSNENSVISGCVNIKKTIEYLLGKQYMQNTIQTPLNSLLIYFYCDAFPWLTWSTYFTGETTIRIKLVEPYNLLSTIITVSSYLGPDNYSHMKTLCQSAFKQLTELKEVWHPINKVPVKVYVRGQADGANRRAITASPTALSTYSIEEAPEHQEQLGDMTIYCAKPLRTVEKNKQQSEEYTKWLGKRNDTTENRREFMKTHIGFTGYESLAPVDIADIYPGMMHRCINATQTITLRICEVARLKLGDKGREWMRQVSTVARKVSEEAGVFKVKFSEDGVVKFSRESELLLKAAGFTGLMLEILSTFCEGIGEVFKLLLYTPLGLTGEEYEVKARALLGFQFVILFGFNSVTATIKQVVAYSAFYINKAAEDGKLVGLPITLHNFTDSIMETKHKECKQGNYCFSGGKSGDTGKEEYQKRVLEQQFVNEWMRIENRENWKSSSSDAKVERKKRDDKDTTNTFETREQNETDGNDAILDSDEEYEEDDFCESDTGTFYEKISRTLPEKDGNGERLKRQLLDHAQDKFGDSNVNKITMESAYSFASSLDMYGTFTGNIDKLQLHAAHHHDLILWERKDARVSKEVFVFKTHFKRNLNARCFTVEHHPNSPQSAKRLVKFEFTDVMGIHIDQTQIQFRLFKLPLLQRKGCNKNSYWENDASLPAKSVELGIHDQRFTLSVRLGTNKSLPDFHSIFLTDDILESAVVNGLKENSSFIPDVDRRPENYLPVVKDPTLVHSAQLAILDLIKDPRSKDVIWLIKMYDGLYKKFKSLLRCRLSDGGLAAYRHHEE